MNAKVIFINRRELQATSNQYALASTLCNEQFSDVYIRLEDVMDFVQSMQNASAEEMIKAQESFTSEGGSVTDTTSYHAEWRTYNYILSELRRYKNEG